MKFISLGKCNIYYIYIILYINSLVINDYLYGHNFNETFSEIKIFPSKIQKKFSEHHFVHYTCSYFVTLILSIIFKIKYSSDKDLEQSSTKLQIHLIHKDMEKEIKLHISFIFYLIIIFLWIFEEQLLVIYIEFLKDIDFWMIELLIITYLSAYMFKNIIYKHQKCAIIFNASIPLILKILTIFYTLRDENKQKIYYKEYIWLIPLGFFIYLVLITLRSFVNSKIKWYMDIKYIYPEEILVYYGIIGAITCMIISIITTLTFNTNRDIECYNFNISQNRYSENLIEYFKFYSCAYKNNIIEIVREILTIIFSILFVFFNKYLFLLVIKYFTPVHIIFSNPFYFIFDKLFLMINTLINTKKFFIDDSKIKIMKFALDLSSDIFSIIGFLIYLEIIVFHFCDYDHDIKPNIMKRSFIEANDNIYVGNMDETFNSEEDSETDRYESEDLVVKSTI